MSGDIKTQFQQLTKQFKALDKNIRRVALLGVVFFLYSIVDSLVVLPLTQEYESVKAEIAKTIKTRERLEKEINLVSKQLGIDPNLPDEEQLDTLKAKLVQLDESLKTASAQFVTSDEMIGFLNDLLVSGKNLQLLTLEKLPLEFTVLKTIENNNSSKDVVSEAKVFRHGLSFQLSGRYVEIVKYMQALENLPWRIFWEASDLNTDNYPNSTVSFKIYTLSLNEDWLTL